ncbi:hypothetical protein ACFL4V_00080 [Candidatus Latescibacterota bacterium]
MRIVAVIFIFALAFPVFAQERETRAKKSEYLRMPINISIRKDYSLGHSIGRGRKIINHLSLNIISGRAAKLRGIEIGGAANIYSEDIFGIQLAGLANVVEDWGIGIQAAGLANVVEGNFSGIQLSGLANVVQDDSRGIQLSGLANVIEGGFIGIQGSGLANVVQDGSRGIQFSSLANVVEGDFIGIQGSGLANVVQNNSRGIQLSGLANVIEGGFIGIQGSGIANVVQNNSRGIQLSGLANVIEGDFIGIQGSGIANVVQDDSRGIQLSGLANVVEGDFAGIQGSGIANVVQNNYRGIQVSGLANVAENIRTGIQLSGIVNTTNKVEYGSQIAPINLSRENEGIPVGLVSCVEGLKSHIDVWGSETRFINVGLRSGTEYIHNLVFLGAQVNDPFRWSIGWGIGGNKNLTETAYLEIDASIQHINEDEFWTSKKNLLSKLRIIGNWQISDTMSIYAGPTLNYLVSEVNDGSDLASWSFSEKESENSWKRLWPGIDIGVRFEGFDLYPFFSRQLIDW